MSLEDKKVQKFHSAVRWGKPREEISALLADEGIDVGQAVTAHDEKNGNTAMHVAAQNGNMDICKFLAEEKADVNAQNKKGQTPLHMSIEYDFYYQTKMFINEFKADTEAVNGEGHKAITGIDGQKLGAEAWDSPVTIFKASGTQEELEFAFEEMTKAAKDKPESLCKAAVVQTGMAKKKNCAAWNEAFQGKFKDLLGQLS
mmetsp:Transcript_119915/g.339920  ORF Transcript_119915/g.339920 Transcript_119915/m.339920 type:complete len:201 (-) Transcript_119915:252-854(-)|eukprot:CAMPEP_0179296192 /NCGR_PEP_ID=MMETSP0797-20121207/44812_1 /TAXON_ID=47934 /ORGANISM="Dinophysis acuminata, Strain DAEP01" /LENGTH=200 /DNA_ID=CAMNT_0021005463 /DNA_START=85 /DNA_END=687 /DNA_ORIENTATION=-